MAPFPPIFTLGHATILLKIKPERPFVHGTPRSLVKFYAFCEQQRNLDGAKDTPKLWTGGRVKQLRGDENVHA